MGAIGNATRGAAPACRGALVLVTILVPNQTACGVRRADARDVDLRESSRRHAGVELILTLTRLSLLFFPASTGTPNTLRQTERKPLQQLLLEKQRRAEKRSPSPAFMPGLTREGTRTDGHLPRSRFVRGMGHLGTSDCGKAGNARSGLQTRKCLQASQLSQALEPCWTQWKG
jgi:hypothetical protein